MDIISDLVGKYIHFIKENITVEKIEHDTFEIQTPFLDRRNDFITIYAILNEKAKSIILTDNGTTLTDLELSGLEFNSSKRKRELQTVLNGFGVHQESNKCLSLSTTFENFANKKHNFIQALLSVNDMFVLAKSKVMNLFFDDVGVFFDDNDIRYTPNIILEGKSHFNHKFDYLIPKSKTMRERTIKLLNRPKVENLKATLFAFEDTRISRDDLGYIILNDEATIKNDFIDAIRKYDITPMPWSQKNNFIENLVA